MVPARRAACPRGRLLAAAGVLSAPQLSARGAPRSSVPSGPSVPSGARRAVRVGSPPPPRGLQRGSRAAAKRRAVRRSPPPPPPGRELHLAAGQPAPPRPRVPLAAWAAPGRAARSRGAGSPSRLRRLRGRLVPLAAPHGAMQLQWEGEETHPPRPAAAFVTAQPGAPPGPTRSSSGSAGARRREEMEPEGKDRVGVRDKARVGVRVRQRGRAPQSRSAGPRVPGEKFPCGLRCRPCLLLGGGRGRSGAAGSARLWAAGALRSGAGPWAAPLQVCAAGGQRGPPAPSPGGAGPSPRPGGGGVAGGAGPCGAAGAARRGSAALLSALPPSVAQPSAAGRAAPLAPAPLLGRVPRCPAAPGSAELRPRIFSSPKTT